MKPMRVGIVGAGMISEIYLKNMIERFDQLDVVAICSRNGESAKRRATQFGIEARSHEDIINDPEIEMIVNLTPAPQHESIIRQALEAGKHVYTEKTVTMCYETAEELRKLAEEKGLYLCAAPDTFLGAALQNARRAIDEGLIGEINSFAVVSNRGNDYLRSFYRFLNLPGGGVGYDYAVYYLTALISLLGPAADTCAVVRTPYPKHIDINPAYPTYGTEIETPGESEICAILRLHSGVTGTLHFNNESVLIDQAFFAIYGTKGILYLANPNRFGGCVYFLPAGTNMAEQCTRVAVDYGFGFAENSRGIGAADMADAIRYGRKARTDVKMACHVLEIVDAMIISGQTGTFVSIKSDCEQPEAMVK